MYRKYIDLQRKLRSNMPAPERVLWWKIRNKQLGVKFRRQYAVAYTIPLPHLPPSGKGEGMDGGITFTRIFDFYCPQIKLAIELDGDSHYTNERQPFEEIKQDNLLYKRHQIKVIRFLNTDITNNLPGVIEIIQGNIKP